MIKGNKYLCNATDEEVKAYADKRGYCFNSEDIADLRSGSFNGETVSSALTDYLNAYGA